MKMNEIKMNGKIYVLRSDINKNELNEHDLYVSATEVQQMIELEAEKIISLLVPKFLHKYRMFKRIIKSDKKLVKK